MGNAGEPGRINVGEWGGGGSDDDRSDVPAVARRSDEPLEVKGTRAFGTTTKEDERWNLSKKKKKKKRTQVELQIRG